GPIAPNGTCRVTVTATAPASDDRNGELQIAGNAPESPVTIELLRRSPGLPSLTSQKQGHAQYAKADELHSGEVMHAGDYLVSSNGQFKLQMQSDGNLVEVVQRSWRPIWSAGTWGHPGAWAIMQSDGNLV